jgi:hypothetical protein
MDSPECYNSLLSGSTMPAKDTCHDAVKNALIKDGWTITADPYYIIYRKLRLVADVSAQYIGERVIQAPMTNQKN